MKMSFKDTFEGGLPNISGNAYRYLAFTGSLANISFQEQVSFALIAGLQILAPLAVLMAVLFKDGQPLFSNPLWPMAGYCTGADSSDICSCSNPVGFIWQEDHQGVQGLDDMLAKILGVGFIIAVNINIYRYLRSEADTARDIQRLKIVVEDSDIFLAKDDYDSDDGDRPEAFIAEKPEAFIGWVLVLGRWINAWCGVTSSLILPFLFYASEDAKSIVMDSLAITFLLMIDDIGGGLDLIGADTWDGDYLGICCECIKLSVRRMQEDEEGCWYFFNPTYFSDSKVTRRQLTAMSRWATTGDSYGLEKVFFSLNLPQPPLEWVRWKEGKNGWLAMQELGEERTNVLDLAAWLTLASMVWFSIMFLLMGRPSCSA
ncbi:unnamed protein product [Polarella glacialis]|uniref:Uncharacterized protein n=1 Tax=Polarella glacialis TaxID=89957 RepID=A0A813E8S9_POLGL|nr:unnamed protein product [Polarella glacialis]